jgi:predicted membrane channel-forming protein YqfA (hemolysin III family)
LKAVSLSKSWLVLAGVLIILELLFVSEAIIADLTGLQRIFGVFTGIAILCFAALLYSVSVVFYGWR